jgi:hypothetical protein
MGIQMEGAFDMAVQVGLFGPRIRKYGGTVIEMLDGGGEVNGGRDIPGRRQALL